MLYQFSNSIFSENQYFLDHGNQFRSNELFPVRLSGISQELWFAPQIFTFYHVKISRATNDGTIIEGNTKSINKQQKSNLNKNIINSNMKNTVVKGSADTSQIRMSAKHKKQNFECEKQKIKFPKKNLHFNANTAQNAPLLV